MPDNYELIKREVLYKGIFCLARYHLRFRRYDENWSNTFSREILERSSAAAILPYDPILDQIVLIEQFRAGALKQSPDNPWLFEIVAGIFDKDETPQEIVIREAEEEAGCEILDLLPICDYFVSPGGSNEYLHLFIGRVDASNVGGTHGLPDENEDIRAFTLSSEEAFTLLQERKIKTSPAIIALQWLQLNRDWLRELWQTKQ
jgi:ADP-ribose pyrophosphatase